MTTTYKIAAIPGDGIGAEVIDAGLEVLDALCGQNGEIRLAVDRFDWGADRYRRTGLLMPEDGSASQVGSCAEP